MKKVVTIRDVEDAIRAGADLDALAAHAIVTPSAVDMIRERASARTSVSAKASSVAPTLSTPAGGPPWKPFAGDPAALLAAPSTRAMCEAICDIGRRLWTREYVDGNGGNISVRLAENVALCTPTGVSKGFMRPEDMCLVDLDGRQLAGARRRTSEILMHLEIYRAQPAAVACVHAHPPTATAFAAAGVPPPNNILSEFELFVGEVPVAPYETPGTIDIARKVAAHAPDHTTILMANHGAVAWSPLHMEDAYFRMEILEAYCRTIMVAAQLGRPANRFTPEQVRDLMVVKKGLGVPDPRIGLDVDRLRAIDEEEWHPGVTCVAPAPQEHACRCNHRDDADAAFDPEAERLVGEIVDTIMRTAQARA